MIAVFVFYVKFKLKEVNMLNKIIAKKINQQMNREFQASYLYLDIGNYYGSVGLSGFKAWFNMQFQIELEHARVFITYLLRHGEKIDFDTAKSNCKHFCDFMEPMKFSMLNERANSLSINEIYNLARDVNDYDTVSFIKDFINKYLTERDCNFNKFIVEIDNSGFEEMNFRIGESNFSLNLRKNQSEL